MTEKFYGEPTNFQLLQMSANPDFALEPGGIIENFQAKHALNIGDFVYLGHAAKALKGTESGQYQSRALGVVVGGYRVGPVPGAILDPGSIGVNAAQADEIVTVMRRGICYTICDATGILKSDPLTAGRTTAGRIRGDTLYSFARTPAGLVIKAGASALVKAANITQTVVAGLQGTATAANLDQAALSGTVLTGTHNVFVFRIAANGSTVTSAMGTAGATRDAIVFPAGDPTLAVLGYVFINPTGTGSFVGGTTALDDATVVPNATYVNLVGFMRAHGLALADGGAAASALLSYINCL